MTTTDNRYRVLIEHEGLNPFWVPCNHEMCNDPKDIIREEQLLTLIKKCNETQAVKRYTVVKY